MRPSLGVRHRSQLYFISTQCRNRVVYQMAAQSCPDVTTERVKMKLNLSYEAKHRRRGFASAHDNNQEGIALNLIPIPTMPPIDVGRLVDGDIAFTLLHQA